MFSYEYSSGGVFLAISGFIFIIVILIATIKYLFKRRSLALISQGNPMNYSFVSLSERVKYKELNENQFRSTFFNIGLSISISFSILILNWQMESSSFIHPQYDLEDILSPYYIPRIANKTAPLPVPPPPLPSQADILPVEFPEILMEPDVTMPQSLENSFSEEKIKSLPPPLPDFTSPNDEIPEIFVVVDQMPRFFSDNCELLLTKEEKEACAQEAMLSFIYKNVKYPIMALQNRTMGRAVIQFVVEPDGSISNIELQNNLKDGLSEEALRVVKLMASEQNWIAGHQRGRAVRVRFTLPIQFSLR